MMKGSVLRQRSFYNSQALAIFLLNRLPAINCNELEGTFDERETCTNGWVNICLSCCIKDTFFSLSQFYFILPR